MRKLLSKQGLYTPNMTIYVFQMLSAICNTTVVTIKKGCEWDSPAQQNFRCKRQLERSRLFRVVAIWQIGNDIYKVLVYIVSSDYKFNPFVYF